MKKVVLAWVAIVLITLILGGTCQWLLFSDGSGSLLFLGRWGILWALYFMVAHWIVERVMRLTR